MATTPGLLCRQISLSLSALLLYVGLVAVDALALSPLSARGYALLPTPQKVTFTGPDIRIDQNWIVSAGPGVQQDDIAMETLLQGFETRLHRPLRLALRPDASEHVILLEITPGSVSIEQAADDDKTALAAQAYELKITPHRVRVRANAGAGLFYAVQSLLQLLRPANGGAHLPCANIVDWPDLQLRMVYWDDAHHLEYLGELKRIIRQAAALKINGLAIKLDGHFQYRSAPAVVEPYALSPAEFQELTNYGLRHYVQIIPYLDAPAHIAFILKHPEYAKLRAFPRINYELCVTNPDSYKLMFGMFEDLLAANNGVNYFFLSTDEPYYVGLPDHPGCREALRAKDLGGNGKLLAEFITRTADFLRKRGRNVIFWPGDPMKAEDVVSLPKYLINGEVYDPGLDAALWSHGIRQMISTNTQGLEYLFPNYSILPMSRRLHPPDKIRGERVSDIVAQTLLEPLRKGPRLMGSMNAAWADQGLHPETFWLGYAASAAAAWCPNVLDTSELSNTFFEVFYGPNSINMGRVYQLMSLQAQFWADSWDTIPSASREPTFGNCIEAHCPEESSPADDQTLPLPPVPSAANLSYESTWSRENARRVQLGGEFLIENEELVNLLYANLARVDRNRYNLEVLVSVAQLYRQNLFMIRGLANMDAMLEAASKSAMGGRAEDAVAAVDQALAVARQIRADRDTAFSQLTRTWLQSWNPRTAQANGRSFLHEMDDVKDHLPDRTVDMKYVIFRQLLLPFGEWVSKIQSARNEYARRNTLSTRETAFDWNDTVSEAP